MAKYLRYMLKTNYFLAEKLSETSNFIIIIIIIVVVGLSLSQDVQNALYSKYDTLLYPIFEAKFKSEYNFSKICLLEQYDIKK